MSSIPEVTASDHVVGNRDASIVLVEYGDFQCPDCKQAEPHVKELVSKYGSKLAVVFRNMPLDKMYPIHPQATVAAHAAEAAGCQDMFWQMHDELFDNQDNLSEEYVVDLAEKLGLSLDQFEEDFVSDEVDEKVESDYLGGQEAGVTSTPTFFINGQKVDDSRNYADLLAKVAALLGE